ncbi:MAG TPA: glucosaminidase domain-containing protein [Candidatus Sulfotelmatobacter sp.]|nr:glucosaminidase domain-containing protein [Candidatus Sulfotelmatobacter sp.]
MVSLLSRWLGVSSGPDMTESHRAFLARAAKAAVWSETRTHVPAEMTLAQALIESGWGDHCPGNNCLGIKVHHTRGLESYGLTPELAKGGYKDRPHGEYELYGSLGDCFADHAQLLRRGVYRFAWDTYQRDGDCVAWIKRVAKIYARDEAYFVKIDAAMHMPEVIEALRKAREPLTSAT